MNKLVALAFCLAMSACGGGAKESSGGTTTTASGTTNDPATPQK